MLKNIKEVSILMEQLTAVSNFLTDDRKHKLETIKVILKENQDNPEIDSICGSVLSSNPIFIEAYQLIRDYIANIIEIDTFVKNHKLIGPLRLSELWDLREECLSSISDIVVVTLNKFVDAMYYSLATKHNSTTYFVSLN